jgi:hypothetical protein
VVRITDRDLPEHPPLGRLHIPQPELFGEPVEAFRIY